MVMFFVACLAALLCGTASGYSTYFINGREVSEDEFRQMSNGFGGSSFGKSPFGNSQNGNQFDFPPRKPLQRKPSLMGSSTLGTGGLGSTVTYLVNGVPVTKEEFEAASAKRPPGGSQPSPFGGYQPGAQSSPQRPGGGYGPQSSPPKTPQGAAKISELTKQKVTDLHNKYREDVATGKVPGQPKATQMSKLVWDDELSKIASAWAARCEFKHSDTEEYCGINGLPSVGENLGTGTMRSGEEMMTDEEIADKILNHVKNWFDEHVDYTYNSLSCQPGKKCGHYTQVISDKSDSVGCGVAMCNNGVRGFVSSRAYLVACNYGPAGNIYGEKPYVSDVSSCPIRHPKRQGAFCVGEQTEKIKCQDTSSGCAKWKREGKCAMCRNPYYDSVTSQCPQTCGVC